MQHLKIQPAPQHSESGAYVTMNRERWYQIRDVDHLSPFFITLASGSDHWLFLSSTSGLTAGRRAPEFALFPYITVDRIHESHGHTGAFTHFRVRSGGERHLWSPWLHKRAWKGNCSRNLYKNSLGTKVCFEEINHTLNLCYRLTWATSDIYGFVVSSELVNLGRTDLSVELLSGLQNILPANTPRAMQETSSNLVDAYKRSELDPSTRLGLFTLYSAISDRAQANESLRANTAFVVGIENPEILIDQREIDAFVLEEPQLQTMNTRGVRGAYMVHTTVHLSPQSPAQWSIVANLQLSHSAVTHLRALLLNSHDLQTDIQKDVASTEQKLVKLVAGADGLQTAAEEAVTVHHYANTLFNLMRGGTFVDGGVINKADFIASIAAFDQHLVTEGSAAIADLPDQFQREALNRAMANQGNRQLRRLALDYLPISFGRRHGDPSRPWNHFDIKLTDAHGKRALAYEGNWRDIFQNWEALGISYPEFIENMIAKFINASTIDGYNPYRVTESGIDWEIEDPEDPWSYIGYWGDHQIIYLLKFLEMSEALHPGKLKSLLLENQFAYANVPYRLKPFEALVEDPKNTVIFDHIIAEQIDVRVSEKGNDGKLLHDADGQVYLVSLLEKLVVPLLSKLSNFIVDGGIWLNTQRPEWNDGNNALVGHGISFVTLCYLRRYTHFLQQFVESCPTSIQLTEAVGEHLNASAAALKQILAARRAGTLTDEERWRALEALGTAGSEYRARVYHQESLVATAFDRDTLVELLSSALRLFDLSIAANQRSDGLFHTYNLLALKPDQIKIDRLYPMLEGQVAALSAKSLSPEGAIDLLESLFASDIYRADLETFMLYPDRALTEFLEKNVITQAQTDQSSLITQMLAAKDYRLVEPDANGSYRFQPDCVNADAVAAVLATVIPDYGLEHDAEAVASVQALYEAVFNHHAFTGRSGGMFGFEGLGCVYWHMVGKLLLAVQETVFDALDAETDADTLATLVSYYYRIRNGLGFNKSPEAFGAIPFDPYSHSPMHAGAQQPGMTGQVKEEILSRFGELGLRVEAGALTITPQLLQLAEFTTVPTSFNYLDLAGHWQEKALQEGTLAFTWCQIPIIYKLGQDGFSIMVHDADATSLIHGQSLSVAQTQSIMAREGIITALEVAIPRTLLLQTD